MGRLKVFKSGYEFIQVELISGNKYVAGRSKDCEIVLEKDKGISRRHIQIWEENGIWSVQLLSQYGALIYEDQPVEALDLYDGCVFSSPPYEFHYLADKHIAAEPEAPVATQQTELLGGETEVTSPGISHLVPFLKIYLPSGHKETLQLEGSLWTAGRDPSCEIHVPVEHLSRRHFDLTQTNEGFFLTDLGSSNGTLVNGNLAPAHEPIGIQSGDVITIMDVRIEFQVRDTSFEDKLQAAVDPSVFEAVESASLSPESSDSKALSLSHSPQALVLPDFLVPADAGPDYPLDFPSGGAVKVHQGPLGFWHRLDKNQKIRVVLIALLPLVLFLLFSEPKKEERIDLPSLPREFDHLTDEQKNLVIDLYRLAQRQFQSRDFELCLVELRKLHDVIPSYLESKILEQNCRTGWDMQQREIERRRELERLRRIEAQVKDLTQACAQQITRTTTTDEIRRCLREAIELSPENPGIWELIQQVEAEQERREQEQQNQALRQQRFRAGQSILSRARSLREQGQALRAIAEYEKFVNGNYPDLNNSLPAARSELSQLQTQLNQNLSSLIQQCQQQLGAENYREAIMTCRRAQQLAPQNTQARNLIQQAMNRLRQKMQPIYQKSVIEEDIGNVDAAKAMWQEIREKSIPGEDYYDRATNKLRQYKLIFD